MTNLPEESVNTVLSAYSMFEERMPFPAEDFEIFVTGFIFGMRFGLACSEIPQTAQQRIILAFYGNSSPNA